MSATRFISDRLRRRYFTVLGRLAEFAIIPLDVDADLPVLGVTVVDGQALEFAAVPYRPRLRVAVASQGEGSESEPVNGAAPVVIGVVLGLDYDEPKLHLRRPEGPDVRWMDWAARSANTEGIEQGALTAWQAAQRNCDG